MQWRGLQAIVVVLQETSRVSKLFEDLIHKFKFFTSRLFGTECTILKLNVPEPPLNVRPCTCPVQGHVRGINAQQSHRQMLVMRDQNRFSTGAAGGCAREIFRVGNLI